MNTLTTEPLAEKILRMAQDAKAPFPTRDCETVARQAGIDPQNLVSDLDTYFYDVWSPGNGVKKLYRKSDAWLSDLKAYLEQGFFSRYARYVSLEALITQENAPDLYQRLQIADKLRRDLVLFLSDLLARHEAEKPREVAGV
jgi:hypothetical protein